MMAGVPELVRIRSGMATGLVMFAVACKVLRMPEPGELLRRGGASAP